MVGTDLPLFSLAEFRVVEITCQRQNNISFTAVQQQTVFVDSRLPACLTTLRDAVAVARYQVSGTTPERHAGPVSTRRF